MYGPEDYQYETEYDDGLRYDEMNTAEDYNRWEEEQVFQDREWDEGDGEDASEWDEDTCDDYYLTHFEGDE